MRGTILLLMSLPPLAAQTPAPVSGVEVNGSQRVWIYKGWPAGLRLTLAHPALGSEAAPWAVQTAGSWASLAKVETVGPDGARADLPWRLGDVPSGPPSLAAHEKVTLEWALGAEDTRDLAAGEYRISVRFGEWEETAALVVKQRPELLTVQEQSTELRLLVRYESARGQDGIAIARLENWLVEHPEDAWALGRRAMLLESLGRRAEAFAAYQQAVEAARKQPAGWQGKYDSEPDPLMLRRGELLRRLVQK